MCGVRFLGLPGVRGLLGMVLHRPGLNGLFGLFTLRNGTP
jgi:hypothetical protein